MRYLAAALMFLIPTPLVAAERRVIGLAQNATRIEASIVEAASAALPTVVLVGGMEGIGESSRIVSQEIQRYESIARSLRQFRLIVIPLANPERNSLQFPPAGVAYRENAESHVLWRWIGIQAPDLVVVAGEDYGLVRALAGNEVAEVGGIPSIRVDVKPGLVQTIPPNFIASEAHAEIDRRLGRSPRQLGEELALVYGRDFEQLTYLPGMALIGRMRLGHTDEVARLAERYLDGRDTLARAGSLTLAGHLVFAELAERTGDARFAELAVRAANTGFGENGQMKESMPYHEEMSDSVFMAIPLLVKAGKLTGEQKYFDMAVRHLEFMQKLVLRPDGLYRHSPLTEAAWGRGNAFPALGLALALPDFPKDHPGYDVMAQAFVRHVQTLAPFQNPDGLWLEVIDYPGAYAEFSATAMIAAAMIRGIREGLLEPLAYQPRVNDAWRAILARTGSDGVLVDVCESTNKQQSLSDYLRRAAILGMDVRGGGMALLFAAERAGLQ